MMNRLESRLEKELEELLGANRVILLAERVVIEVGSEPRGWLAEYAASGDVLSLPTIWQGEHNGALIGGQILHEDVAAKLKELASEAIDQARSNLGQKMAQLRRTMYAAQHLARWAGHGWSWGIRQQERQLYSPDGEPCDLCPAYDGSAVVADAYAEAASSGNGEFGPAAAAAIEGLIRSLYHTFGTEGPVGWGVEHPQVLDDGTIVVSIGYHGQLEGRFAPNGWTVKASGPGGRYVLLDANTGAVIEAHDAQPRDYARARAAVAAAAIGYSNSASWEAERDYNGYFRAAVKGAAREYGMEGNEEYALYAELSHNSGHVLAGKSLYEDEGEAE